MPCFLTGNITTLIVVQRVIGKFHECLFCHVTMRVFIHAFRHHVITVFDILMEKVRISKVVHHISQIMTCNNAKHGQKQRLAKFRKISLLNITVSIIYLIMSKILLYSFLRIIFKPSEFYYAAWNAQIEFFIITIGNQ